MKQNIEKLRSIKALGKRTWPYSSNITIRDFKYLIDEPEKLGGKNKAPTPMEYVLGSLNGCFAVTIEMIAREQSCKVKNLDIQSDGLIDQRGLFGTADISPHFQTVNIKIKIDLEQFLKSNEIFESATMRRCPVYNLIKDSGANVQVTWHWIK